MVWFSLTYQQKTDLSTSIQLFHKTTEKPFLSYEKRNQTQTKLNLVFASITLFNRCITKLDCIKD